MVEECKWAKWYLHVRSPAVGHLWRNVMRMVNYMDAQDWLLVLVGVIVVGVFCLRGFGSRSQY